MSGRRWLANRDVPQAGAGCGFFDDRFWGEVCPMGDESAQIL